MTTHQAQNLPTGIRVSKSRDLLKIDYPDNQTNELEAEFLRISSPSAEVRGHGPGQEVTQFGKRHVLITQITPVGRYAIRIHFSDGHETGIFQWDYLRELADNKQHLWQSYLTKLSDEGLARE